MSSTVRIRPRDKEILEKLRRALHGYTKNALSQEEVLGLALRYASSRTVEVLRLAKTGSPTDPSDDALWSPDMAFDMGATDARSHDRILYGARARSG